jgi:hypothetical protein
MFEFLPLEKFSALDSWAPVTPAWTAYHPQSDKREESASDQSVSSAKTKR